MPGLALFLALALFSLRVFRCGTQMLCSAHCCVMPVADYQYNKRNKRLWKISATESLCAMIHLVRLSVRLVLGLVLLVGGGLTASAENEVPAADIVRDIYAAYTPDSVPEGLPERLFTEDLLARYSAVEHHAAEHGEAGLGFDIFIDAQDFDTIGDLSLREFEREGARLIDVEFSIFGEYRIMRYVFLPTAEGWKIDNIEWGEEGANLRDLLEETRVMQQQSVP